MDQSNTEHDELRPIGQVVYVVDDTFDWASINTLIGVDIEHSKEVGYDGKICLIQISTVDTDIVIDPLLIKDQPTLKANLKSVFENPLIKKVFYAGTQDQLWLLRDFDIQVNNSYDIKDVAELLYPRTDNSLVGLWSRFCQYEFPRDMKKTLQKCDWTVRPLSSEQMQYAAIDAHYLPYLWNLLSREAASTLSPDELTKLQQRWSKPRQYKRECNHRAYFLKKVENIFEEVLEDFDDYYHTEAYTQMYLTEKNLIKFIFSELSLAQQRFAMENDVPAKSIDNDEDLITASVVLFKMLNIPDLGKFKSYYDELKSYSNQHFQERCATNPKGMAYLPYKNLIANGFMNCLQRDPDFVKWALTDVHYAEFNQRQQLGIAKSKAEQKLKRTQEYNTSEKDIYGTCLILGPDNLKLTNCPERKGQWYINKGKAELVSESPMVIRINFQPSGFEVRRMEGDQEIVERQFYTTERINQCVVCGSKSSLLRYNIIPPNYKSCFPHNFKTDKTHGFVLLCLKCSEKANAHAEELKETLAKEFKVPLKTFSPETLLLRRAKDIQKSCKQYKSKQATFPEPVKVKFQAQLISQLNELLKDPQVPKALEDTSFSEVNEELFEFVDQLEEKLGLTEVCEKNIHGQLVVDQLTTDGHFRQFIERWRNLFLESMNPKFLPDAWFIDGKPKSTTQEFYE